MSKTLKRTLQVIVACAILMLIGYLGYRAYLYIIADATQRIEQSIKEMVEYAKR